MTINTAINTAAGPIYCYKSDLTGPFYLICSMKSGITIFEDISPQGRFWRRLAAYYKETGDKPVKFRLQTPHELITWNGSNYRAFRSICKKSVAFHELDNNTLNQECTEYAALSEDSNLWEVYTVFHSEEYRHVGKHQALVPELNKENQSSLIHSISLNSPGVVLFT